MKSKTWWWILIVLWCGMIFYQSSKPSHESEKESLFIVTAINKWVSAIAGREVVAVSDAMVRKSAHGFEYFVLGILLLNGFFSGKAILKALALSLAAGIAYAVSDEIHQYFIPGRTMRVIDVMVDTFGLFCGTGLMCLLIRKRLRQTVDNC
jgi:VanZ family protein